MMIDRIPSTIRATGICRRATRTSLVAGLVIAHVLIFTLTQSVRAAEPAGNVLLYTDNTPGAIVYANGQLGAANRNNYDVQVVTSVSAFENALPTKSWNYVIVVEKHSEGAPAYTAELATYLECGAWAVIYRWKEDASNAPTPTQIVQAPTAVHVWANGDTAWGYYLSKLDFDKSSGTSTGYVSKSFEEVEVQPTSIAATIGMSALTAGNHAAAAYIAPPPATCEDVFHESVAKASEEYVGRTIKCMTAYGPRPNDVPPSEGNPTKLKSCLNEAADIQRNDAAKIVHDFFVCVDIRTAESQ